MTLDKEAIRQSVLRLKGNGIGALPELKAAPKPRAANGLTFARGDHVELAHRALATLETDASPVGIDDGVMWRYSPASGLWETLTPQAFGVCVASFAGAEVIDAKLPLRISAGCAAGALTFVRDVLSVRPDRPRFARAARGIAFANGFLVIAGEGQDARLELRPHSPANLARVGLPFDYDPRAPHPMLTAFFDEIFGDCLEEERGQREMCLQEFVGASLFGRAASYQRALIAYGVGDNGKSAFLDIARAAFPAGSVTSLSPAKWHEKFSAAVLDGKLANFVDELPSTNIAEGQVFKSIVTGNPISVERKNQDPFELVSRAGHIFSANKLPQAKDQSIGFGRRFRICPFTRAMSALPIERPDAGLVIAAREAPGIAAWAARGALRRAQQSDYTESSIGAEMRGEWRDESSPIRMFLRAYDWSCEPVAGKQLYDQYVEWAKERGFTPANITDFGSDAKSPDLSTAKRIGGGMTYRRPGQK